MDTRKLVSTISISILLLVALSSVSCGPTPTATPVPFNLQATLDQYLSNLPDGWGMISPAALNEQLQTTKPFLVEVRETKEVADAGYIAGAINIPIRTLIKNLDKLPAKDQPIIVTCGSGHRSALGMEALQLLGYTNVKSLAGGLGAWKAANLPVVTGTPPEAKAGKMPDADKDLLSALDKYFSTLPDGWGMIAPAALNELLKTTKPFQLEVREVKEVADSGFIAGSTNIPIRTLIKNLEKLPPDKGAPIIAECDSGHRSAMVMMALSLLGYTNTRSLASGFTAWTKAGLPTSK
jgi:rhodanese-related sulfurtransferase